MRVRKASKHQRQTVGYEGSRNAEESNSQGSSRPRLPPAPAHLLPESSGKMSGGDILGSVEQVGPSQC